MSLPPDPPEPSEVADPGPEAGERTVADGRERSLDPRSVIVERVAGAIGACVLGVPIVVGATVGALVGSPGAGWSALLLGGAPLIVVLLVVRALVWPGVAYRYARWRADERGLRIRRGVIWRTEIFVPKSRVQHTDVSRGPIDRGFGLAKLILHTAGTHDASVVLEGLAEADAFALRDFLVDVDGDDAV